MKSIRRSLTVSLLAGSVVVLLVVDVALGLRLRSWLIREFDAALYAKARTIATLVEQDTGEIEFDPAAEYMPEFDTADQPEYYELYVVDGPTHTRSPSLVDESLPRFSAGDGEPVFADLELPDGRAGRLVCMEFDARLDPGDEGSVDPDEVGAAAVDPDDAGAADAGSGGAAVDESGEAEAPIRLGLIVAKTRSGLDGLLASIYALLAVLSGLYVVAVGALTRTAVTGGLRPLTELNRRIEAIDERSLAQRVTLDRPATELAAIVDALNGLIARLQAAMEKEKRFTGDVAHELRTPLAELRNLADVGGAWPEDTESIRAFFDDVRDITGEMLVMTENLLTLARCDGAETAVSLGEVAVAPLVDRCWTALADKADRAGVGLAVDVAGDLRVTSDETKLRLVIANLMDNVISYSAAGSKGRCTAAQRDGTVTVRFDNPSSDLDAADLEVMFDRFWRKDPARTDARHAGLGLSVVRSLCDVLGIGVSAALDGDRTLSVTLRIPAAAPARA